MSEDEMKCYEMGKMAGQKANAFDDQKAVADGLAVENEYLRKQLDREREAFGEKVRKYKAKNRNSLVKPLLGVAITAVLSVLFHIVGREGLVVPELGEPLYRAALAVEGFFIGVVFERFKW